MMTDTTLSGERAIEPISAHTAPANCSQNREQQRGMPIEMLRMMGLDTAAKMLGKGVLADELCITVRALNMKINAERGICNSDLVAAYCALEAHGHAMLDHARKLRAVLSPAAANGEGRATFTASFRALEVIRDGDARLLIEADKPMAAAAHIAIIDNAIRTALDLAHAVKAAAAGDQAAAGRAVLDLCLDQVEVR